ncbi:MAG: long-chain fatty acid transporter, partial [Bacteroidetes bacterium]|nr:long-chain fatty acid transporter [Bacteroidota bacterium]
AYTIDDESDFDLFTEYNNFFYVPEDTTLNQIFSLSDIFVSDYSLTVPWRFNAGAAFFFSKNGFISADLEFVNYSNISLGSNDFSTVADNTTIENLYKSIVNFKVGAEYRFKALRFRAGFAHLGDPFAIDDGGDRSKTNISGGIGFRNALFYGDFAIVASKFDSLNSPYSLAGSSSPRVTVENQITSAVLTFGLFF